MDQMLEARTDILAQLLNSQAKVLGYIYPHAPLEIILAHDIIPSLVRADPLAAGAYEASLQTFCCAFCRNLFSQRNSNTFPPYSGILFPAGTCDSLQNLGDIWRARFPEDNVLRLTYPVSTELQEASRQYLAEELKALSNRLTETFNQPFSEDKFKEAVTITAQFRDTAQFLTAARILQPLLVPYTEYVHLLQSFVTNPGVAALSQLEEVATKTREELNQAQQLPIVEALRYALLKQNVSDISIPHNKGHPRIVVTGGMIDPEGFSLLFDEANEAIENTEAQLILDIFTFTFRMIFTASPGLRGDPFEEMARSLLTAPTEPTQEGLPRRIRFLEEVLTSLHVDGLIICEQSFCDPDEFEVPALETTAKTHGIPTLRLHLDPEFSDRIRLEGKLQSFIETLTLK
jgi:benzoyl-CoA reductase/2-hydroxyglutaryl-CoA dehydratase subunit BcrC/BadD/HgdB